MSVREKPLGRIPPADDRHLRRFSLTPETAPAVPSPLVLGINWYSAFDSPELVSGSYWIGRGSSWGRIRGGHAICAPQLGVTDTLGWWRFYDQGNEGACVGFAVSRAQTLMNRERYDAFWTYHQAQRIDEWPGEDYDGTSVRAGMEVARTLGLVDRSKSTPGLPDPADGISAYRWPRSIEEAAACLSPGDQGKKVLDRGWIAFLNSWGEWYPHLTRMSLETAERLFFREDGDVAVATDR